MQTSKEEIKEDVKTYEGKRSKDQKLRESFNTTHLIIIKDLDGFFLPFLFNVAKSFWRPEQQPYRFFYGIVDYSWGDIKS